MDDSYIQGTSLKEQKQKACSVSSTTLVYEYCLCHTSWHGM